MLQNFGGSSEALRPLETTKDVKKELDYPEHI